MDDDPETPLRSYETSEQNLDVGEQKHSAEIFGENPTDLLQHQESGDTGPVLEQDALKKSISGADVPEQSPQAESKTSLFRRKDVLEEGQPSDLPGSVKSSVTSLRKPPSHRSSQRLIGQESRRSSQQSVGQQQPLSQKPSRAQTVMEADAKDVTWVSKRTGKVMKCRSQQTSLIWEQKTLSDILRLSAEESDLNRDEEETEGTTTAEDTTTSAWETTEDQPTTMDESQLSSQELEEKTSMHAKDEKKAGWESPWGSQRSLEKLPTVSAKSSAGQQPAREVETGEEVTWISKRTGKEMKTQSQQTSSEWEARPLNEILHSASQESQFSSRGGREEYFEEPLETIDSCRDDELEELALRDSLASVPRAESRPPPGEELYPSGQPLEGEKSQEEALQPQTEQERAELKSKVDQAQQTDSAESLKKELVDSSQQTENASVAQLQEAHHDVEQVEPLESRRGSQESEGQVPQDSVSQSTRLGSRRSSYRSLEPEAKVSDEKEAEPDQKPSLTAEVQQAGGGISDEETTWVSRRTGKLVRCQSQQTDRSWLQYYSSKMQKVKKCSSQQTDKSFLQRYAAKQLKAADREAPPSTVETDEHKQHEQQPCCLCGEVDLGFLHLIDIEELDLAMEEEERKDETQGSEGGEVEQEQEAPLESPRTDMVQTESQEEADKEEPQRDERQESQDETNLIHAAKSQVQWPEESGSKTALESPWSDDNKQDASLQSYSIISAEDGIWLNRKTGKLLTSHSQQTSETRIPTAWEKSEDSEEEGREPLGNGTGKASSDVEPLGENDSQREVEVDGQRLPIQESQDDGQAGHSSKASLITVQPTGEEDQDADDVEKLLSSRLSEATLLSVENPDVEDEPTNTYAFVSAEKGTWVNMTTGKLLESQSQQTEESCCQDSVEEVLPFETIEQESPEDDQLATLDSSSGPTQQPLEGEGADDDPAASEGEEPRAPGGGESLAEPQGLDRQDSEA